MRMCARVWKPATVASFLPLSAFLGPQGSLDINSLAGEAVDGLDPMTRWRYIWEISLNITSVQLCVWGSFILCFTYKSLELPFKCH